MSAFKSLFAWFKRRQHWGWILGAGTLAAGALLTAIVGGAGGPIGTRIGEHIISWVDSKDDPDVSCRFDRVFMRPGDPGSDRATPPENAQEFAFPPQFKAYRSRDGFWFEAFRLRLANEGDEPIEDVSLRYLGLSFPADDPRRWQQTIRPDFLNPNSSERREKTRSQSDISEVEFVDKLEPRTSVTHYAPIMAGPLGSVDVYWYRAEFRGMGARKKLSEECYWASAGEVILEGADLERQAYWKPASENARRFLSRPQPLIHEGSHRAP